MTAKDHLLEYLSQVPLDSHLHTDEVLLKVASKIMEGMPKGMHDDLDSSLAAAVKLAHESEIYLGQVLYGDDPA